MPGDAVLAKSDLGFQPAEPPDDVAALGALFHRLNNQLGTGLAHAELIVVKSLRESERDRADHIVEALLGAMVTAHEIHTRLTPAATTSD